MLIAEQYSHPQPYLCVRCVQCGFTVRMRQSYIVPFSSRVAFAEIFPNPPARSQVHYSCFSSILTIDALSVCALHRLSINCQGGVHGLTCNWLMHAGGLCLSYTQATGFRTPTQTRACPTLWRWLQLSASHTAVKAVVQGPILRPWPDQFSANRKKSFKTKIIQSQSRHFSS